MVWVNTSMHLECLREKFGLKWDPLFGATRMTKLVCSQNDLRSTPKARTTAVYSCISRMVRNKNFESIAVHFSAHTDMMCTQQHWKMVQ
jgi:hypothetical protein